MVKCSIRLLSCSSLCMRILPLTFLTGPSKDLRLLVNSFVIRQLQSKPLSTPFLLCGFSNSTTLESRLLSLGFWENKNTAAQTGVRRGREVLSEVTSSCLAEALNFQLLSLGFSLKLEEGRSMPLSRNLHTVQKPNHCIVFDIQRS